MDRWMKDRCMDEWMDGCNYLCYAYLSMYLHRSCLQVPYTKANVAPRQGWHCRALGHT